MYCTSVRYPHSPFSINQTDGEGKGEKIERELEKYNCLLRHLLSTYKLCFEGPISSTSYHDFLIQLLLNLP